ncbi:TonB-dependent receptor [Rheinheimera riviphila]|uniref:TonB-dependent receptor n=1 Tax=Rheinheimera riviphila TaxID=1834037 RepID=A0A437R333_9GAMM|nr:TonB-dependent receptor [Rheinheimera riviphila]RVU41196.1 TonB-dependent receptor [Rheinheimera riviphila]
MSAKFSFVFKSLLSVTAAVACSPVFAAGSDAAAASEHAANIAKSKAEIGNAVETNIERLVVTATQQPKPWLSSSAAINSRDLTDEAPALDIASLLQGLPGVQADQRANFAQDSRISLRGFGSRSSFGVRGIEVLLDGQPWSTADGQSQPGSMLLDQLGSVEVLRGPFAALYGNSAGGVLALRSKPIAPPSVSLTQVSGNQLQQQQLQASSGQTELSLKQLKHDGFRPHNSAEKRQASLRQTHLFADYLQLNWRYDWSDDPLLQDPLGLTFAEWQQNPSQTAAVATLFNSQKNSAQRQLSMQLEPLSGDWQLGVWHGQRDIQQLLAFSGDAISSAGGVVNLNRHFFGLKGQRQFELGRWWLQYSAQFEQHTDQRQGYVNQRGSIGDLRRDESGQVQSSELGVRSEYLSADRWRFSAGVRLSQLKFAVTDYFIRPGNPDDSGEKSDQHPSFALGVSYPLLPDLSWSLNMGQGFETPTLTEMAYQSNGGGLNLALKAARNQQIETGVKYQTEATLASLDLFYIKSRDELVVDQSVGGRTSYRNAASSSRHGLELFWQQQWSAHWQHRFSSTLLDSSFEVPNNTHRLLPGVARVQHDWLLEYRPWQDDRWLLRTQLNYRGKLWVDDANSLSAPAVTLLQLDSRWQFDLQHSQWQFWLGLENALDKTYAGAVVVNQANGRSFEPGIPRQWVAGMQLTITLD